MSAQCLIETVGAQNSGRSTFYCQNRTESQFMKILKGMSMHAPDNEAVSLESYERAPNATKAPINLANIVFVKLHKVGGSTLQSILYRYATEYRLRIARTNKQVSEKWDVLAHHITLQKYLQIRSIDNQVFVTLLRNPLDHACSLFYWNWNGKQFRREMVGNFTTAHILYLSRYSRQNRTEVFDDQTKKELNLTYTRQWEWFSSSSPQEALESLIRLNFSVGFMEGSTEASVNQG